MKRSNHAFSWIEAGYRIFAEEGLDGIQIERLSRILNLNKSGFYHHFGNSEGYYDELLKLHKKNAELFIEDILEIKTIDPEYLQIIVKHAMPVLFQIKLIRCKPTSDFYKLAESIDQRVVLVLRDVWANYIGFQDQPELAIRYYSIVRDMLYTRVNAKNLNYSTLRSLMTEAKDVMQISIENKTALEADDSIA